MVIKAPFNFVPVSEKVFFPDWSDKISQDIPFEDGMSGTIELTITAKTPLFIRNGQKKTEEDNSFSHVGDNRYFVPGTSLKGSIRNVLEIMSFGKMNQVNNDTFGVRDLKSRTYRDQMTEICCGWLQWVDNKYMLTDCGTPGRISLEDIDEKYDTDLFSFVQNSHNFKNDENKTAKKKYEMIEKKLGKIFLFDSFETDRNNKMSQTNRKDLRRFVKFGNDESGTIVFTGQPSARSWNGRKRNGKLYEFVFFEKEQSPEIIDEKIINSFKNVHKESADFEKFWGPKLNKGEKIPIFFKRLENGELHSIGLSYMYKYPYEKSVRESIPGFALREQSKQDLAECMFGFTNNDNSLKGRIQFSALFSENAKSNKNVTLLLGSPKASYYPIYIRQSGSNELKTYDKGQIAGWKRYLVRKETWGEELAKDNENSNIKTTFKPLDEGTIFMGKIRFHNLKKVELGALLSALTFHNNSEKCYHQLGQGKPYGFGRIKVDAELSGYSKEEQEKLMASFEEMMNQKINPKWCGCEQIKELFTLSSSVVDNEPVFEYMRMDNNRNNNEFLEAKKLKEYLEKYTELPNQKIFVPESLIKNS